MRFMFSVLLAFASVVVVRGLTGQEDRPKIQTSIIPSGELPERFDQSVTYQYKYQNVEPDSLLTELWSADVPVVRAWLPLDNMCMDPVGPRFTVELSRPDSTILEFDFFHGAGRLGCATQLKQFVIVK